jgi:sirohydrochlorin ferrochelatase
MNTEAHRAIATFPDPSLPAQLAELKRERKMRARVYPHLVSSGKLTQKAADYQNQCLDAAIRTIERLVVEVKA